ncbi:si:dkey-239i20.4 isoform X2 [Triplophysa dalaica]|nr:si:dkey-239i20.4 isoform X2 [Triplophysa dalaica]
MAKRVAVIGAGCSGLVCIKCCLDEGMEPVCFESSDDIGGLWRFKETQEMERTSIYRSLIANTSKEMMCFSDFPMPDHFPNYMHNSLVVQYFRIYTDHFDLRRYIHFQTTVRSVRQRPDFSASGQWDVVTTGRDGREEKHVFDGVLVCTGQYTQPTTPAFPGVDSFPGVIAHSYDYKDPDLYRGMRLVIVGIGNSGGDIAVELSRLCEKTFLSTRTGAWITGRVLNRGLPMDMMLVRRNLDLIFNLLPRAVINWIGERMLNQKHDHQLYGLQPKYGVFDQRPIINDDLPGRILVGELVMKPNLQKFQGSTLMFNDGTAEENIDAVIFCTGYNSTFPFLPSSLNSGPDGELTLYRRIFPPSLERPTLGIMGLFQTKGAIMPAVELQARWATRVIKGLNHLPSAVKMHKIIEKERRANLKCYPCPKQAALQVPYIPYLDTIAKEVGVCPNIVWLLLTDPALGMRVLFGPCTPYQFRLSGPGHWRGARQAILTQWDRVAKPMKTRPIPETKSISLLYWLGLAGGAAVICIIMVKQKKIPVFLRNTYIP